MSHVVMRNTVGIDIVYADVVCFVFLKLLSNVELSTCHVNQLNVFFLP